MKRNEGTGRGSGTGRGERAERDGTGRRKAGGAAGGAGIARRIDGDRHADGGTLFDGGRRARGDRLAEGGEGEWLAGRHTVLEALRAGRPVHKIWIAEGASKQPLAAILQLAKEAGVPVQSVDRRRLDQAVPGIQHQGVAAQAAALEYADLEDVLAAAERKGDPPLLLLLDEIEDPHNLGSMLRTADAAGVHGVVIPRRRSAGLTAAVAKVSAGAAAYVPVARTANLAQTIDRLKESGIWVAGADASAEKEAFDADLTGPLALVIGNENRGLGRLVREKCDFLVRLPMLGRIQSLNASVAAGVLLYEIVRQRRLAVKGVPAGETTGDKR
mgnify:FL=1|jgi:23S rRNA (guanosine2251-2'-O)-methyltransferase